MSSLSFRHISSNAIRERTPVYGLTRLQSVCDLHAYVRLITAAAEKFGTYFERTYEISSVNIRAPFTVDNSIYYITRLKRETELLTFDSRANINRVYNGNRRWWSGEMEMRFSFRRKICDFETRVEKILIIISAVLLIRLRSERTLLGRVYMSSRSNV